MSLEAVRYAMVLAYGWYSPLSEAQDARLTIATHPLNSFGPFTAGSNQLCIISYNSLLFVYS